MKKLITIISLSLLYSNMVTAQCQYLGSAEINFNNGSLVNSGGTLTIPYSLSNNTKKIFVKFSPHPYNSLNTGQWETYITYTLNGSTSISGINLPNNYSHQNGSNFSGRNFPFTSLSQGTNIVCVTYRCGNGPTTSFGCFTIIVDGPPPPPSGNITLTTDCCTSSKTEGNPPRPVSYFNGLARFKMTGTMVNSKLKIISAGNISYENFAQNGFTNCYSAPISITIVDNNGNAVPNSKINNLSTYAISKWFKDCVFKNAELKKVNTVDKTLKASILCNVNGDCPSGTTCVNGICQ